MAQSALWIRFLYKLHKNMFLKLAMSMIASSTGWLQSMVNFKGADFDFLLLLVGAILKI
jgi:hypothetical protein